MNSATPLLGRTCLARRDIALRCPRRVQRRNCFECRCRWHMRSARYYAGGDGAARHPYQRANRFVPLKSCTNVLSFSGSSARRKRLTDQLVELAIDRD